ncbi:uncharacterized protein [Amphiura filiformis]|uniref:uncharacterized protein n=1 Tax=Amphiura filiformis TaxID=82378 RepID=UPI003B211D61
MHRDKREQESQSPKQNKSQEEAAARGSNVVTGCTKTLASAATSSDTSPLMTIIPVLVKHEASDSFIATYAFLDNGCDAVFASSLLQQRMNLRTQKEKLLIGTLTSKKTVNSKVVLDKLLVGDLNQKNFIPLPQVYIEDKIPVSAKDAPTQEDLRRWAHLCDIQLPVIPSEYPCIPEVTMMIGSNTPAASMPLEVATGEIGEPYAILTPLGWAVYGIPGRSSQQVQTYFCSVIEGSLETMETQFQSYVTPEFNKRMSDRGLPVKQLVERPDWIKGPAFLSEPEEEWPGAEPAVSEESPESTDVEVHAVTAEDQRQDNDIDQLIEHYSSWTRLRRAAAWWLRLKKILRTKQRQSHNFTDALTVQELKEAECAIIKHAQKSLQLDSKLTNLDPQVMDGMVRVGGRLKNAKIPQNAKHQLIIPKDHHIATLIVRYIHGEIHHQGSNHVLAELRQKYWIVKARAKVKSVLGKCIICRKHRMPVSKQKMADLPAYRVKSDDPAFTVTGLDYFGPFYIKQGRVTRKRYGMLFTCMNSRAVHIEVAHTLDTSSCIDGIRRFIARRGPVKVIHSDNGTNLVGADNELRRALQELDQDQIQNFSTSHTFEWRYNPPAASHHGGVWERQIRTVRKLMCAILNEQHLKTCRSDEQLHTFMCEIESTLNSRPLTRVSDDPDDLDVIAPRDLLLLRPRADMPPGCFVEKDIYARRRWRQIQYLADLFWQRWLKEYLPELQRRQRWLQPQRNLKMGDVVLIVDESAPRNSWLMGKIVTTLPDKNGRVRQVDVRTKSSTLRKPISKLCLLLEAEE